MKVLFLARSLCIGGAERQLVMTAIGLRDLGHDVKVSVFYSKEPLENELISHNVPLIDLKKTGRWDVFLFYYRFFKLVRFEKPDVIYSYLNVPNVLTGILKLFWPTVKIVWGVRASNMDLSKYDWLSRISYRIECILSRYIDLIICNSFAGKDYSIAHSFPAEKTVVIPNGIDSNKFSPSSHKRTTLRAEWNVSESDILIGIVARLDPMKDHTTFFKAAALLSNSNTQFKFVIIGDGLRHYKVKLVALTKELGIEHLVIWAGARTDMDYVYNALDITCSSSLYGEGFSNAIAEAMLAGLPCVATDVGDSAMLVQDVGKIVPPNDANLLCIAIKELVLNLTPSLKETARKSIESRFSTTIMIKKTEEALIAVYGIKR